MQLTGKKILLTGGSGFIGSALVRRLSPHNKIVVVDNFHRGSRRLSVNGHHIDVHHADVLNESELRPFFSKVDVVVHLAAIAGIDTVAQSPTNTIRVNVLGTLNVLDLARAQPKPPLVCVFSTSEVFGTHGFQSKEVDKTSVGPVGEARWTYAASKLCAEHAALSYYSEFSLPVVVIRPFNIYGPGQIGEGAINSFVKKAIRNETIKIRGSGSQIRAWCYIDDFIDGVVTTLTDPRAIGESFNIGNARAVVTVSELARIVKVECRSDSMIEYVPGDFADVELRVPDVSKAKEMLGFEARVDLPQGIKETQTALLALGSLKGL